MIKVIFIDKKIFEMMVMVFEVLIYWLSVFMLFFVVIILRMDIVMVVFSSLKMIDIVVEVGILNVLKRLSSIMFVSMMARKMIMIFVKKKNCGLKMFLCVIFIMLLEKVVFMKMFRFVIIIIMLWDVIWELMVELRKLIVLLLIFIMRLEIVSIKSRIMIKRYSLGIVIVG